MVTSTCQYHSALQLFHGSMMNVMGTRFDIVLSTEREAEAKQLWQDVVAVLGRLNGMLNRFNPQSELSKINSEALRKSVLLTPEMLQILQLCAVYHSKTFGYFDVTLRDFSKIHLDERVSTVCFSEETALDLGGFAKGYAMRHIEQMLVDTCFNNAFVDFGNSSITALGHHPHGDCWKVSIGNPFDNGNVLGEFELRNSSLSTSGNTPFYGRHIVNPLSGNYIEDKKLICVVAPNALDAEILTTTLMVAPDAEKEKIIGNFTVEQHKEFNL